MCCYFSLTNLRYFGIIFSSSSSYWQGQIQNLVEGATRRGFREGAKGASLSSLHQKKRLRDN